MPGSSTGCPAYAGMDPVAEALRMTKLGLPRLRGDGPLNARDHAYLGIMAAPPTRGWTHSATSAKLESKSLLGCPAYAGMDPLPLLGSK